MRPGLLLLEAIRDEVQRLAAELQAPDLELPSFGRSDQDGRPHIEVGDTYDWVVCERGSELERRRTRELDELLYWSFQSATFSAAVEWELHHRVEGRDPRRLLFQRQHELLARLSPAWAARRDAELELVLRENPYDDDG